MNDLSANIIFEDENLLVINKPAGLVVHDGSGETGPTLEHFLSQYFPDSKLERHGIAHRLDKDTSGVILIAKTQENYDFLKQLFKDRNIKKHYVALVTGKLEPETGTINIPIARDMVSRTKFRAAQKGREAVTNYKVSSYFPGSTLVDIFPKTGRTHQIRVHFSSIKHPVVADSLYGTKTTGINRQFLHATQIEFEDMQGNHRNFVAELPPELTNYLATL
ncbi:MAG: RluA family pseudouridine synthase [Patescibacteria group bacterium]